MILGGVEVRSDTAYHAHVRAALRLASLLGALSACGVETLEHTSASIIGGEPALRSHLAVGALLWEVPEQLAEIRCSGALIAPDVVLVAAHCLLVPLGGALPAHLYFSTDADVSSFAGRGAVVPVGSARAAAWVAHPGFDPEREPGDGLGQIHDLGLVFLDAPQATAPLALARAELAPLIVESATVTIVGYGARSAGGVDVGLRVAATSRVNAVGASEIQVGDRAPTPQKCRGDSGGPTLLEPGDGLVPASRVIGVASRAYDATACATGAIDTRVDAYFPWIAEEMVAACADGRRAACEGDGAPLVPARPNDGGEVERGGCACVEARDAPAGLLPLLLLLLGARRKRRRGSAPTTRAGAERGSHSTSLG